MAKDYSKASEKQLADEFGKLQAGIEAAQAEQTAIDQERRRRVALAQKAELEAQLASVNAALGET